MRSIAFSAMLMVLWAAGCAAGSYGEARLMDFTDVLDVRYGTGVGLGARVEATMFVETGLGYSTLWETREFFGRRASTTKGGEWTYLILGGTQRHGLPWGAPAEGGVMLFGVNATAVWNWSAPPPALDRFRFGVELLLPRVNGGLFLNVGEIIDLIAGIVRWDPAADDGVAKGTAFEE